MKNATVNRLFKIIFKNFTNKTALNQYHRNIKGKMVEFAGYDMPVQYEKGILAEHFACRKNAALFDVSHMGQVRVYGKDRTEFLESLCVSDLKELKEGSGVLTLFTNENGGIIDDSIVTNMGSYYSVVFNAGRKEVDLANLNEQLTTNFSGKDVKIEHLTDRSLIAFQGPKASMILQKMFSGNLSNLGFMEQTNIHLPLIDENVGLMRCGYTGEDGFEISISNKNVEKVFDTILRKNVDEGVLPAGLGSRDSLRLEAALCLYGHDANDKISPLEANLKWIIGKRRRLNGGFKGFKQLEPQISGKQELSKLRVGFKYVNDGPPAREGSEIQLNGKKVGNVTSGTRSPCLNYNIGMGYVNYGLHKLGTDLEVNVRGKMYQIKITKMPFVPSNYYKKTI